MKGRPSAVKHVSIHCIGRDNAGQPTHPHQVPEGSDGARSTDSEWLVTTFVRTNGIWERSLFYWRDGRPTSWTLPLTGVTQRLAGDQYLSEGDASTHTAFSVGGTGRFRYKLACKQCGFARVVQESDLFALLDKLSRAGRAEVQLHTLAAMLGSAARL